MLEFDHEFMKFGDLFKKYRLKSEFSTLSELANTLSQDYGLVFEESTLSRWQAGNRIPRDRHTLRILVEIFIKRKGIVDLKEANRFFELAGQGYLTERETHDLPPLFNTLSPFQAPREISHFIGRNEYINQIETTINKSNMLIIGGPAGIGKTALAIKTAYLFRDKFPDGVLWYRLDTSHVMNILSSIAITYGEDVSNIKDVEARASTVRSILSNKKALIILDNAEVGNKTDIFLPGSFSGNIIFTTRYLDLKIDSVHKYIKLNVFDDNEVLLFFSEILGKRYTKRNEDKLLLMAQSLGNLPLAVNILGKQLKNQHQNIRAVFHKVKNEKNLLKNLEYENRNLYISLNLSIESLEAKQRSVFFTLGIFAGQDFSINAVSYTNKISYEKTLEILEELVKKSLIERSIKSRYRLHPLIKVYSKERMRNKLKLYALFTSYYERFLKNKKRGDVKTYNSISQEIDNISYALKICYKYNKWRRIMNYWEYIGVFLWDTGDWLKVNSFGKIACHAAEKLGDKHAKALCVIRELSWLYYWKGEFKKAEKWALLGLKISIKLKNDYLMAYARQRLGKIYQNLKKMDKAKQNLTQSLLLFNKLGELERAGDTLTYIGEQYILENRLNEAEKCLQKALKITNSIHDVNQNSIILGYLGEVYYLNKSYHKAKKCFEKSLSVAMIKGMNVGGKVWCNIGLALIASKTHKSRQMNHYIEKANESVLNLGIYYDVKRPLIKDYVNLVSPLN